MVSNGLCANKIFHKLEQIQIVDIHNRAHGYFGLIVIENVGNTAFTIPMLV